MVEGSHGPLDRLGNSRVVLKTILGFGAVAAEVGLLSAFALIWLLIRSITATSYRQASCRTMHKSMGGVHP